VQFCCLLKAAKNDAFKVSPHLLFLQELSDQHEEVVGIGHKLLLTEQRELLLYKF
jgi:hypothetical protein